MGAAAGRKGCTDPGDFEKQCVQKKSVLRVPKHYDYNFGELHGEGHRRFAFLRRIMCETPVSGLRPSFREYYFDNLTSFQVNVIDTWNMTIEDKGVYGGTDQKNHLKKYYALKA